MPRQKQAPPALPAPPETEGVVPYIPEDQGLTVKFCRDCANQVPAEGITYPRKPLRPIAEFYRVKDKSGRYKGGYRYSAYCIPHQSKRNSAAVQKHRKQLAARGLKRPRKKLDPQRKMVLLQKRKTWDRTYRERHANAIAERNQRAAANESPERKRRRAEWYQEQLRAWAELRDQLRARGVLVPEGRPRLRSEREFYRTMLKG